MDTARFVRVKVCECPACQYARWYKRSQTRRQHGMPAQPRPVVKPLPQGSCHCRVCMIQRLKAANQRNRQYRTEIKQLKRIIERYKLGLEV